MPAISDTQKEEIRIIEAHGKPAQKVRKTYFNSKPGVVVH
jgi:hypothetical protein